MSVSVVLRLVPEALALGRLAGEAELVSSGERVRVGSAEELVRFLATRVDGAGGERDPGLPTRRSTDA